jgi:gliding motility-associated lipoprotein GldH
MKRGRHFFLRLILISLLPLLFCLCSDNHIYHQYKKIPDYNWNYDYEIPFEFTIKDTQSYYNIYLNIRNAGIYPYSNIWIVATRQDANGTLSKRRYEFVLANPDGSWTGNGLGDIIDNRFILEEHTRLTEPGEYKFSFRHDMRTDLLPAIMDIGLEVEKAKNQ